MCLFFIKEKESRKYLFSYFIDRITLGGFIFIEEKVFVFLKKS